MKTIKIGLLGLGNIGTGTYKTLEMNRSEIESTLNAKVEIVKILERDTERDRGITVPKEKFTSDPDEIFQDPEIDIVIELLGGIEPATTFMLSALKNGKHVVTANKAALAANYHELINAAKENNVILRFEASVGGGIPIIRTINESLAGDVVEEISGILNGTTNYILTKMYEEGWGFDEALKMAQKLGYAERNPEADIEGYDTCRKIAILTAAASGQEVDYEQIPTEGITKLTDVDFSYAARLGASIKLFGTSICRDGRYYLEVAPVFINARNPLYSVSGVFNGILLNSNMLGESMYYGSGAGKLPTASAVVGDMIAAVQLKDRPAALGWTGQRLEVLPVRQLPWKYFARFEGSREEKKTLTEELFGKVRWLELAGLDEFAILTGPMTGEEFDRAAGQLGGLRRAIRAQV